MTIRPTKNLQRTSSCPNFVDFSPALFRRWLQAATANLKGHRKMIEVVKLIALSLILTKDSIKLNHIYAEYRKEANETNLTLRRILAHAIAATLATATLVFYATEIPSHVAHVAVYMA
jgi:hypothetical protein